jgi:PAP2 superfamily C-terminal
MTQNLLKSRWKKTDYRRKYIITIVLAILMLAVMPYGFDIIQSRGGLSWNDQLLNLLPAFDLSLPIFVVMYSLAVLIIYRVYQNPHLLFEFVKAYIIITVTRFVLIYLIPLDPPQNMVSLLDPITRIFYGGKEITRDLFFSGHTSTMFLIYLILEKKRDKIIALGVTIFIAIALLFQHIHYTADVLAAFPITWLIWRFTSKIQ